MAVVWLALVLSYFTVPAPAPPVLHARNPIIEACMYDNEGDLRAGRPGVVVYILPPNYARAVERQDVQFLSEVGKYQIPCK